MSGRSRRSTTDRRPGLVDQPRKKRTTAEIQEEENRLTLAASARTKATELAHSSAVGRVATKEDEMVREDQEARAHAARPDLLTADQSQPVTDADANSEEDIDMESEHGLDEPPDTDSDGMALGTEPEFDDFAANGDNDGDENYVQSDEEDHDNSEVHPPSDDDVAADSDMDEAETQAAFAEFMKVRQNQAKKTAPKALTAGRAAKGKGKAPAKKKKEKGLLRAEIVNSRDTAPIAAAPASTNLSKRKAAAPPPQIDPAPVTKRARAAEIGGLKANWKKAVRIDERGRGAASTSSRASSRSAMRDTSSEGDYGGTFAEDEPETSLQAAQASKSRGSMSTSRTATMGIKLTPVAPIITGPIDREKKKKSKNEDLPFTPQEYRDSLQRWQSLCLAYIVEWAGATDDAFAAGHSHPEFKTTVEAAWALHFPEIDITPAVYYLAGSAIRNWRSEIGKRALAYLALVMADRDKTKNETKAQRASYVGLELEDMNFVYRDPDNKHGACRSESIMYTFGYHVRITSSVPAHTRKDPKAALAIATAAVERAYNMWSTGVLIQQKVERKNKKSVHSFVAVPWANRAAKYLVIIHKLSSRKWDEIRLLAARAINETKGEISWADEDDTSEGPDPRTQIQLSSDEEDAEPAGGSGP
ncbi:hypothetical protein B0H14DRAFT_3854832 [Mycena olivaceomarginata]|nr:hypothetical protein B0H14DRAFT_3854832 [Mycena olivaceomarginata]